MHNVTEVDSFDATIPVPDDGVDFRTAASLANPAGSSLQALANRTRRLYNFLGTLTGLITADSLRLTKAIGMFGAKALIVDGLAELGALIVDAGLSTGSLTVNTGLAWCKMQLQVDGNSTFNAPVQVNSSFSATSDASVGASFAVGGNVAFQSNAFVTGDTNLHGTTCTTLLASGVANLNGGSALRGAINLQGIAACSGSGRLYRPATICTSASLLIDPAVQTEWFFDSSLSADIDVTLVAGNNGDEVFISNFSGTHTVQVHYPGGASLSSPLKNASTFYLSYRLKQYAGVWVIINYTKAG